MQKVNRQELKWRHIIFSLTALLIVVADQLSKEWIRSNLAVGQSLPETGIVRLTHIRNTGAAFGLFQDQAFALTIIALIGVAILLLYGLFLCRRFPFLSSRLSMTAIGLILGGTVGNLIDRVRFGYVTDFIDFGFWPSFNVADSAVTIGVILLACFFIHLARAEAKAEKS